MKQPQRPRIRQLLALATFLVPLAVLAVLGWMELRRSGELTQAALEREARQFLASARQAVEQQLDLQVQPALVASARLLTEYNPTRTVLRLRDNEGFAALDDIVLLDEQARLVWPTLPPFDTSLPLVSDPQRGSENTMRSSLAAAELLLMHGKLERGMARLQDLIRTLEAANPPGRGRRLELEETEVHARFRLAAAMRKSGKLDAAREQLKRVQELAREFSPRYRFDSGMPGFLLLATSALAELGTTEGRMEVLNDIAENRYSAVADGLAEAVAKRLSAALDADEATQIEVQRLLRENRQRAATRQYAKDYELLLTYKLRFERGRASGGGDGDIDPANGNERVLTTFGGKTSLLIVRSATDDERNQWQCTHVGLNFNLEQLLAPALEPFVATNGNFVLAVLDGDLPLIEPPHSVPADFVAPSTGTNDLTLRAYPSDPNRLLAEARAGNRTRAILLIALTLTAVGGALWTWRTASREAELAALKIDLVSRVSHELKTPLALIRMYGETLGMGRARDGDQAAEFGSIIARESERLTTLIQRILDFSRQQAGTLDYARERHDLGALLRGIAAAYAPHVEAKGALLIDNLPPDIVVHCDANGAESAIVNLLENAIKYGPEAAAGEHEIELVLETAGDQAVVEVRDRGRGIPAGEHARVFDGFYRASNSGEIRGAGLGLGLVQHFARGPRRRDRSRRSPGRRYHHAIDSAAGGRHFCREHCLSNLTETHILVIEDEPDLRKGLEHNLELEGYKVMAAADGKEGLRKAREGQAALILLDLMLPEMPGLEVLQHLRETGRETPIIIISAKGQDADKVRGLELGADDYLTKPFGLSELLARIRAVLRRTQAGAKASSTDRQAVGGVMKFEGLTVDWRRFTVLRGDVEVQLSRYEAEILRMLIEHRGEVVSRQDLLRKVWGYVHLPTTRTVDNHIARLRKKLEHDVENPVHVVTVHGLGYRFESKLIETS